MGVTVALAWRLPDTPDFREKTEPEENRKTFYVNRKHDNSTRTELNDYNRPNYVHSDRKHYHDHRINLEYQKYLIEKSKQQQDHSASNWHNEKWYATNGKDKAKFSHRIYPVLLKRRAVSMPKDYDIHAIRYAQHHRQSRFSLYQSIEKYLNA